MEGRREKRGANWRNIYIEVYGAPLLRRSHKNPERKKVGDLGVRLVAIDPAKPKRNPSLPVMRVKQHFRDETTEAVDGVS